MVKVDETRINLNRYKYSYRSPATVPESLLAVLSLTDTDVAFILEYSRVSNPQVTRSVLVVTLVYPGDMTGVKMSR